MSRKVVIIGGVAGGATAAARLRRLDESAEIVVLERGEYISFANCGLPYYIGGAIKDRGDLLVQSVEGMSNRFRLDIRTRHEVLSIDRAAKTVTVKNLSDGTTYQESYDALLISTGAEPVRPDIPGIGAAKNVFTLRTVPDTDAIKAVIDSGNAKSAVVVGGGFIGLEMVENLAGRGIAVTLVQHDAQVMRQLDFEMAQYLHRELKSHGVEIKFNDTVASFEDEGRTVVLGSGERLRADIVVMAIGIRPESRLAKEAGLDVNGRGGIVTDERMRTSDPAIFAVGDAVEVMRPVAGVKAMIALAGPANREARVAANVICGLDDSFKGSNGASVLRLFGLTVASVGMNEAELRALGKTFKAIHAHPQDHAGYYPGARQLHLKLVYEPDTLRILGAQAVGSEGAFVRIDVIAMAIAGGLRVTDLADLDLAYAPPYASAKDPVNMLGFYAENLENGLDFSFNWSEVARLVERREYLLDVREVAEFEAGSMPGAVNVPLSVLRSRIGELPKDRKIYLFCQSGVRAHTALRILLQNGLDAASLDGGYLTWKNATATL